MSNYMIFFCEYKQLQVALQHHCPFSVTYDKIYFNVLVVLMLQYVCIMNICF